MGTSFLLTLCFRSHETDGGSMCVYYDTGRHGGGRSFPTSACAAEVTYQPLPKDLDDSPCNQIEQHFVSNAVIETHLALRMYPKLSSLET
ncbi:unnamed protein product [Litomosoides sigmodontis]|uniref:Uncharacterized protein n=1 Tax=Litomosoides sigmodontis TaxID=42156 RepID=A0A3P6SPA6_LITSI|nr:unnamed protein product [Litomosoides sigmodontis]